MAAADGPEGHIVERTGWVRRVAEFVPVALRDLADHTRVLKPLR